MDDLQEDLLSTVLQYLPGHVADQLCLVFAGCNQLEFYFSRRGVALRGRRRGVPLGGCSRVRRRARGSSIKPYGMPGKVQMGKLFKQLKMSQSEELSSASHQVLIKENTKLQEDWGVHCWYIHVHVEVKLSFNFRHSSILWVSAVHRHMILVYKEMKLIEATVLQQLDRSSEAQQHPTCTTDALYKRVPPSGFVIGNLWADISVVNLAPAVNCWHQCLLIGLRKTASVHYNLLNGYC